MLRVLQSAQFQLVGALCAMLGVFFIGYFIAPLSEILWEKWVFRNPSSIEIGFVQDMSVHHGQALSLASFSRPRAGPAIKLFLDALILSHTRQMGALRDWLQFWGKPSRAASHSNSLSRSTDVFSSLAGADDEFRGGGLMTAEVSAHELLTLQGAEGVEFDVLFLRLMVRHHEDGIAMARNASAFVRMPKIRKIANDFIYQQEHELAQMDRLITSYGAQSSTLPLPELPAFAMCKGQQLPE